MVRLSGKVAPRSLSEVMPQFRTAQQEVLVLEIRRPRELPPQMISTTPKTAKRLCQEAVRTSKQPSKRTANRRPPKISCVHLC